MKEAVQTAMKEAAVPSGITVTGIAASQVAASISNWLQVLILLGTAYAIWRPVIHTWIGSWLPKKRSKSKRKHKGSKRSLLSRLLTLLALLLTLTFSTGCGLHGALQGGSSEVHRDGPNRHAGLRQGENAKEASMQDVENEDESEIILPAGTVIEDVINGKNGTNVTRRIILSSEAKLVAHSKDKSSTRLGSAQKDVFREAAAKLQSLRGITWLGAIVFIGGVASAFYPPLKLLVGSTTTSAMIALAGLALVVLPTLIVGNEMLILCVSLGAVVLYWFAHRHGSLRGELKALNLGK